MTDFTEVKTDTQIKILAKLAKKIWSEHYIEMMPKEQLDHMIETKQSQEAITKQIRSNEYTYYFVNSDNLHCGYIALQKQDNDNYFISKLYIQSSARYQGIGSAALDFAFDKARTEGCKRIWLVCNQLNTQSIEVYKHKGFTVFDSAVTDFGAGYTCNDYYLEKAL